jgi:ATP-dependent Clp protease adaptor protein ClpS
LLSIAFHLELVHPPYYSFVRVKMSSETDRDQEFGTATVNRQKLQPPKRYKVLMHNDDYTTMEFVVLVLQKYFNKNYNEAQAIMLEVHQRGFGVCGIYTFEVAESKAAKVIKYARENGHPLRCSIEPES